MLPQQEYLGLLIAAARRRLKQAVLRHALPLRLTPAQFWFLNAARELPGASLGEVARRQRVDAPTASRLAVGLAARRLLRMQSHPRDRRAVRIALTASGMKLAERIAPIAASVRAAVVQGLSQREQDALRALLRKVIGNLEVFANEAPPHRRRGTG
jgi:DNA-binding MarR family transcriptional regulator